MKLDVSLTWTTCARCGGMLPEVDGRNDHPSLPSDSDLLYDGDCPGHLASGPGNLCGAYEGWTTGQIEDYVEQKIGPSVKVDVDVPDDVD